MLKKIEFLINTQRFEQAEQELRSLLADNMENPLLFTYLGICLMGQNKLEKAKKALKKSISLAPDYPSPYNLLAEIYHDQDDLQEARSFVKEAIRLDPDEGSYYFNLASIHFSDRKWEESLAMVESGLRLDPESVNGNNIRARILVKLGRSPEASEAFTDSLNKDPDNPQTHVNQAWAFLEEGKYKLALEHFREGLRLDPDNEGARAGLVEALKAKYWLYRGYLKFAFTMDNMSSGMRWGLIIGALLLIRVIPILVPLYLIFVFFSWFSDILFNSLLRLNRFGRLVLTERETFYSNLFLALLVSGIALMITGTKIDNNWVVNAGVVFLAMLFPVTGTYNQLEGKKRKRSKIFALSLASIGSLSVLLGFMGVEMASLLMVAFFLGAVAYTWWIQII